MRESIDTAIRRLEVFVSRMERRYECSSEAMEREVREGRARETAEVNRWLGEHQVLMSLYEARAVGHEPGSTLRNTG